MQTSTKPAGDCWKLSHVYDEAEVLPIVRLIYSDYSPLLKQLDIDLGKLSQNQDYLQP